MVPALLASFLPLLVEFLPLLADFLALRQQLDPAGLFLNEPLRRIFGVG